MDILGISAFYHDSAAVLLRDGRIVAAAQEERFSRVRHDASFPAGAVRWCLEAGGGGPPDLVAFYEKPLRKFDRIVRTAVAVAPRGYAPFRTALPDWMRRKLWIPLEIERALEGCGVRRPPPVVFPEHHLSHAASAFFPSPFERAAVLTVDGVGEWAASTVGRGEGRRVEILEEQPFPHSLGLLYSAFTYFTGFKVNSGEYKLMGLAPYGEPRYVDTILDRLVDLKEDGSFRLDLSHVGFLDGLVMTGPSFADLFDGPPRRPESPLGRRDLDLARSIQVVTEEILLRMARHAARVTGESRLCMAGGVALNCVANGRILREGPFADLWIQPAAGDAGGALGAAYVAWHHGQGGARAADGVHDAMRGARLGPAWDEADLRAVLERWGAPAVRLEESDRAPALAARLAAGQVVGLFDGPMEFGPRALGSRSILGDPRNPEMQSVMNRKIKYRESFRPFAPAVTVERAADWFEIDRPSPYMLLTARVRADRLRDPGPSEGLDPETRVRQVRSEIPAVTHVDGSARLQTVDRETNPRFHALLEAFEALTGCPVLVNTSFNVRGEPIVCTPQDALRCFVRTGMDALALGPFLVERDALLRHPGAGVDWGTP